MSLAFRQPKYEESVAYCHFGCAPYTKDSIKFYELESAKDLYKYASMSSAGVIGDCAGNFDIFQA